jgi:hypothetical protein
MQTLVGGSTKKHAKKMCISKNLGNATRKSVIKEHFVRDRDSGSLSDREGYPPYALY